MGALFFTLFAHDDENFQSQFVITVTLNAVAARSCAGVVVLASPTSRKASLPGGMYSIWTVRRMKRSTIDRPMSAASPDALHPSVSTKGSSESFSSSATQTSHLRGSVASPRSTTHSTTGPLVSEEVTTSKNCQRQVHTYASHVHRG